MSTERGLLRGVVLGNTIVLDENAGLPDGQRVEVSVQPVESKSPSDEQRLEELKAAAGTWADDPKGLAEFLDWNRQQRKAGRHQLLE